MAGRSRGRRQGGDSHEGRDDEEQEKRGDTAASLGVGTIAGVAPSNCQPHDRVFADGLPRMPRYRKDLAAAGIPYVDDEGRYFDFHALRKTFGTMLEVYGASARQTMELMRHSDMRLTTGIYQDAGQLHLREAVMKLPGANGDDTRKSTRIEAESGESGETVVRSWGCFSDLEWRDPDDVDVSKLEVPERYTKGEVMAMIGKKLRPQWEQDYEEYSEMVRAVGFEPTAPAV